MLTDFTYYSQNYAFNAHGFQTANNTLLIK